MAEKSAELKRAERDLRAINALRNSDGWQIVEQVMQEEIMLATREITNPSISNTEHIHFFRGAIWAAMQLLNIPERISMRLNNTISLSATARQGD